MNAFCLRVIVLREANKVSERKLTMSRRSCSRRSLSKASIKFYKRRHFLQMSIKQIMFQIKYNFQKWFKKFKQTFGGNLFLIWHGMAWLGSRSLSEDPR